MTPSYEPVARIHNGKVRVAFRRQHEVRNRPRGFFIDGDEDERAGAWTSPTPPLVEVEVEPTSAEQKAIDQLRMKVLALRFEKGTLRFPLFSIHTQIPGNVANAYPDSGPHVVVGVDADGSKTVLYQKGECYSQVAMDLARNLINPGLKL